MKLVRLAGLSFWRRGRWFESEFLPLHCFVHRFDSHDQIAILIKSDGPSGLADDDRYRFGFSRDRCGSPVACPEAFCHRQVFMRDLKHLPTAFDDPVTANQKGAVELGDLLGIFLDTGIQQIPVLLVVSAKGVDTTVIGMLQNLAGITNDESDPSYYSQEQNMLTQRKKIGSVPWLDNGSKSSSAPKQGGNFNWEQRSWHRPMVLLPLCLEPLQVPARL